MIYYVGEKKIDTASDLTSAFDGYKVGDKVTITVVRDNEMKKLALTLGEKTAG
jgi:S1-C subfamily serine protease